MATISLTIPDNEISEFLIGFLRACPIPVDDNGNPIYTVQNWIKEVAKSKILFEYSQGKRMLQQDRVTINIIHIT